MDRTCSYCGAVAEAPVAWSFSVDDGRIKWLCVECARANIRAIEGKLPEEYWQ